MSKGLNKVQIIGNLGQSPEVRYMPNGTCVVNLSVATSESWTDQQGKSQERTEWHKITLYRKLAEIAGQYLQKGSMVYIEGKLQTRKWQDKQGQDRYTTEIIADQMQMLGQNASKPENQAQQEKTQSQYQQPPSRQNGHTPPSFGEPDLPEPQF